MTPKRDKNQQDRRHRYDANGRQRGLNWAAYGGLESPADPVVDTENEQKKKAQS